MAAIRFSTLASGAAAFHIAFAADAPLGHLAMGGAFPGRFPPAMRALAVVQALVLVLRETIVMARAGHAAPLTRSLSAGDGVGGDARSGFH